MRNELYHYGKGHDDNPPGRGSGRYPYGSKNNLQISKGEASDALRYARNRDTDRIESKFQYEKYSRKYEKNPSKRNERKLKRAEADMKAAEREIQDVCEFLEDGGYTVKSEEVAKYAGYGTSLFNLFMLGPEAWLVYELFFRHNKNHKQTGKDYYAEKDGQVIHAGDKY